MEEGSTAFPRLIQESLKASLICHCPSQYTENIWGTALFIYSEVNQFLLLAH